MKKFVFVLVAALAVAAAQPVWAAAKAKTSCLPANAAEAQEAIRYMTELGVATNACSSVAIYADFRTRNRDAIVDYQKALIAHFHGNAAYDKWNTSLANAVAQRQSGLGSPTLFCQQAMPMLEQAKTLDPPKFRAYAAARAAANTQTVKCGK